VLREASHALAASEARFRTAVELAPDGVVILRRQALIYLNPAALRMLGLTRQEEALGRTIGELLPADDADRAAARLDTMARTGQAFAAPAEYRSKSLDGREIIVEITSSSIEYEGGPATLAFARDITERKAMHEKMIQADRLAAVGTLAAGIAHEINNPLAYVILGLQYIERELPRLAREPDRLEDVVARLRDVKNGAERVGTIVRDLKTFARADEVKRGAVDAQAVVEAALKIADNEIRHRATLIRSYEPAAAVDGNAARFEQVFLNLLVNAAHAVSDGEPGASEVRVSIREGEDRTVVVEIEDNGAGIPKDVLGRVFDPFFTTKPVGVGTGLGLPICRSIVESFGGRIELESVLGEGTVARVTLPMFSRPDASQHDDEPARKPSNHPGARGRLLIVDDEPLVAGLLRRMLSEDHDVAVATSGSDALRALDEATFDVILCDVMMPGMTGMDLYAALRARDAALAGRMVFMTGGAFVPHVAAFLASVDNPKIDKPFELAALGAALREIARRAAAARP
jgi:PAS domain S-box-containing protein